MSAHLGSEQTIIAICGGATTGSEAAKMAAERGALVVVLEQGVRPYGEVEDLVPRWLLATSGSQLGRIDENLATPGILFVPKTHLGRDVTLAELAALGIRSVVAGGVHRDQRMPIPEVARFDEQGLWHRRAFVRWYNHRGDFGYRGPQIAIEPGALVIGDGLGAIDCARIINFELYGRALAARGIAVGHEAFARAGLAATLAQQGLTPADLGVRGATLVLPGGAHDLRLAGADAATLASLVASLQQRDLLDVQFHAEPLHVLEADGRLAGLTLRDTRASAAASTQKFERWTGLVVSAVGSVYEPPTVALTDALEVLPVGETLGFGEPDLMGRLLHARLWPAADDDAAIELGEGLADAIQAAARKAVETAVEAALAKPPATVDAVARVVAWAQARQRAVGYEEYSAWISATRATWKA